MHWHILVGTTSGNTEYLAEHLGDVAAEHGHTHTLHDQPNLSEVPTQETHWLVCVATHGAGEYAESMLGFIEQLQQQQPSLATVKVAIVAVGDSSYDTFCQAGKDCETLLLERGAHLICPVLTIDMFNDLDPEQSASQWFQQQLLPMINAAN